jgi:MFS transporter, DHA2 family, multidrug resistance protein
MPGVPRVNPWLIAVVVSVATFMEVLDTSIANVSLNHIAGSMSASQDESTWVLTSYLVSNAIILPISGWLATVVGRKRFYMLCVAIFTISSLLCGLAPSLGWLIVFRILQGIGGGGLQPSEQAILADTFTPQQRGQAFAIYGIAVVVAPAIGPTLGGWITDSFSWRWIFFINVPIGVMSLLLVQSLLQESPERIAQQRAATSRGFKVDYIGFGLVAIGLGCLQVVLDKGQEDDWLGSNFILFFTVISVIALIAAVIWEFQVDDPIVDLPLLKRFNFAFSNLMMFSLGFILFSTTQLLPQFTQSLLGYTAEQAGLVISPGGFAVMAFMPVAGFLVNRIQPKYLIAYGMTCVGFAMFYMLGFNTQVPFRTLALARIFQASGLAFLFVPINMIAYSGLPPGKSNHASALINLSRNLGGSIGVSVANTILYRRTQFHQNRLSGDFTRFSQAYQTTLHTMTHLLIQSGIPASQAASRAGSILYYNLIRQAGMLAYLDVFKVLGICAFFMVGVALSMKRVKLGGGAAMH